MRQLPAAHLPPIFRPLPLAAAVALAACGGGGGGSPTAAPTDTTPQRVVLSGVAATGAPMANAQVTVFDATGASACTTTTSAAGAYSCDLGTSPRAPFTVVAQNDTTRQYSTAPTATSGTVNITPLTTLIVARLAPDGNPASLVDAVKSDAGVVTADKLQTKVQEVAALLAPLTTAVGDSVNPISGSFAADGTGHDRVLDALQVSIRPEAGASNIQITIKTQPASNDAAPVEINFRSNDNTPPAPPAVTVHAEDLPPAAIGPKVESFFRRMQACYALPLAERIANVSPGTVQATGNAASVQAPACRTLFVGDDPAGYLDNGLRVGAGLAFAGMFRDASTGAVFDRGNFEYRWANGDVFVTFRSTTAAGAVAHQTLTLRDVGGTLKAVGNQYVYDASVRPYAVDREFPLQPQYSFFGTGYNTAVANRIDPLTNQPMFRQVTVTTPGGQQYVLKPQAGRSLLGIVRPNGTTSGTSVRLLAAQFAAGTTAGSPSDKDNSWLYTAEPWEEARLRGTPDQGAWTFEFQHVDDTRPNVRQVYRTVSRAMTMGEVRQAAFVQFSAAQKEQWLARDDVASFAGLSFGPPSASAPTRVAIGSATLPGWTFTEGAVPISSVNVFGTQLGASFNDGESVASTATFATVNCSRQSVGDTHCDDSTGVLQYAAGGRVWTLELWGRSLRQQEMAKHVSLFRLPE